MIEYEVIPKQKAIYTKIEGLVGVDDIRAYFEKMLKDKKIKEGSIEYVDLRKLDDFSFNYNNFLPVVPIFEQLIKSKKLMQTRFIVNSRLKYGLSRVFTTILESLHYKSDIIELNDDEELKL